MSISWFDALLVGLLELLFFVQVPLWIALAAWAWHKCSKMDRWRRTSRTCFVLTCLISTFGAAYILHFYELMKWVERMSE